MRSTVREEVRASEATDHQLGGAIGTRERTVRGRLSLATCCILAASLVNIGAGQGSAGNANRGRSALEDRQCLACHSIAGKGAGTAADLGRRSITTEHSPTGLAALMWSHGPSMWDQMQERAMADSPLRTWFPRCGRTDLKCSTRCRKAVASGPPCRAGRSPT